jgi:hypothetical protein
MLYEMFKLLGGADAHLGHWFGFVLASIYAIHIVSLLGGWCYQWCYSYVYLFKENTSNPVVVIWEKCFGVDNNVPECFVDWKLDNTVGSGKAGVRNGHTWDYEAYYAGKRIAYSDYRSELNQCISNHFNGDVDITPVLLFTPAALAIAILVGDYQPLVPITIGLIYGVLRVARAAVQGGVASAELKDRVDTLEKVPSSS